MNWVISAGALVANLPFLAVILVVQDSVRSDPYVPFMLFCLVTASLDAVVFWAGARFVRHVVRPAVWDREQRYHEIVPLERNVYHGF